MYLIAEAGLNHNGNMIKAFKYCRIAKDCGADAVKFQATDVKTTWDKNKPEYTKFGLNKNRLLKLEIKNYNEIKNYCDKIGIDFMATPSTIERLDYLMSLGMKIIKIGSDRACEKELIDKALTYKVPVLVSNGMYKFKEKVIEMYCKSEYPCKDIDWSKIGEAFSDHTIEYNHGEKLAKMKIKYYEKHIKINDNCIDSCVSLYPWQFKKLINTIRMYS